MHLTKYTDYSIRTLMFLGVQEEGQLASIATISATFRISRNHLMKVVNDLVTLGLVESVRGRSGGIRLGRPAADINVGALVRELESVDRIVDCDNGPCLFRGACEFERAIQAATDAFFAELSRHTLADLIDRRAQLSQLVHLPAPLRVTRTGA